MTPHTVAGYDLLELFFWALDRLGIQPTVTQIRVTLLALVGLVVLVGLVWWRRSPEAQQQEEDGGGKS